MRVKNDFSLLSDQKTIDEWQLFLIIIYVYCMKYIQYYIIIGNK